MKNSRQVRKVLFIKRIRGLGNLFMLLQLSSKWLMKHHSQIPNRKQLEPDFLCSWFWAKNLPSQPLKDSGGVGCGFLLQIFLYSLTPFSLSGAHLSRYIHQNTVYIICSVSQLILLSSWAISGTSNIDRWGELLVYTASLAQQSLKTANHFS